MYVYLYDEDTEKYQVGFYDPTDNFILESEYTSKPQAAAQTSYLNGGNYPSDIVV